LVARFCSLAVADVEFKRRIGADAKVAGTTIDEAMTE